MNVFKFWQFSLKLTSSVVVVKRPQAKQVIYFDKAFHSQKNLGALAHIDDVMREGEVLKSSKKTSVVKTQIGSLQVVVKRYHTHRIWDGIKQWFRVSPAYNSWFYAHWLIEKNIPTPKPLATVEQKLGLIRKRSYYIYQYLDFESLSDVLLAKPIDSPEFKALGERVVSLFMALFKAKTHDRDFKISNFLVHHGEIYLIDLDSVSFYVSDIFLNSVLKKDQQKFLEVFKDQPDKYQYFSDLLPQ